MNRHLQNLYNSCVKLVKSAMNNKIKVLFFILWSLSICHRTTLPKVCTNNYDHTYNVYIQCDSSSTIATLLKKITK